MKKTKRKPPPYYAATRKDMVRVTLHMPIAARTELKRIALDRSCTLEAVLREAVVDVLKRYDRPAAELLRQA